MQTTRRLLCALSLLVLLGGCESLLPVGGPPPQLYQLSPKSTFPDNLPPVNWQLIVEVPFASSALNTTRIAVMPTPLQVDYYARAAWTDRVPLMLQTLMVESFQNTRRIVGVGRDTIGLRSDFILKTELRDFQAEAHDPAGGLVRIGIDAKLVRMPERLIVAAAEFREAWPAKIDDLSSVVTAYDEALGRALKKLVTWTIEAGVRAAAAEGISASDAPTASQEQASQPWRPRRGETSRGRSGPAVVPERR